MAGKSPRALITHCPAAEDVPAHQDWGQGRGPSGAHQAAHLDIRWVSTHPALVWPRRRAECNLK